MLRSPTAASLGTWGYANALRLHGIYLTYLRTGDTRYLDYVKAWADSVIGPQGNIYTSSAQTTVRTLSALEDHLVSFVLDNFLATTSESDEVTDERFDDPGIDHRTALRDLANSPNEVLGVRDALLQQVRPTA